VGWEVLFPTWCGSTPTTAVAYLRDAGLDDARREALIARLIS
jgi:hypothetical protein